MIVSIICAMDHRNGIGFRGKIPWRLTTDLRRFKQLTMGHHLIAGRITFESIGRALPGRSMIIITRNPDYHSDDGTVAHSFQSALDIALKRGEREVFIIGGAQVYQTAIIHTDTFYLTRVHAAVQTDVFFPAIDFTTWIILEKIEYNAGEIDQYPHTFMKLMRSTKTSH